MFEAMAWYVSGSNRLVIDRQLGFFDFEDGFGFLVVVPLRLVFRRRVGENASCPALVRSFAPFEIIPSLFIVA